MLQTAPQTITLQLPLEINAKHAPLEQLAKSAELCLIVPNNYEQLAATSEIEAEVFAVQRLIAISRLKIAIKIKWEDGICKKLSEICRLHPLLAVAIMLQNVEHLLAGISFTLKQKTISEARNIVLNSKAIKDLFPTSQLLLCADSLGQGRHKQLYLPNGGNLRPREDFETLVQEILTSELQASEQQSDQFKWAASIGVIVTELFENTEMHGMKGLNGSPLGSNSMRGLIFRRIQLTVPKKISAIKTVPAKLECLEISIFDTGIGYLRSFTKSQEVPDIDFEWNVLHQCLERHYDKSIPDTRPAHRGLGLAEVLKILQNMGGKIEVRTGRLWGYRTFVKGELQVLMEKNDSQWAHKEWPKPSLLDAEKKFVTKPTIHEDTIGSAIRVIIPLANR